MNTPHNRGPSVIVWAFVGIVALGGALLCLAGLGAFAAYESSTSKHPAINAHQ